MVWAYLGERASKIKFVPKYSHFFAGKIVALALAVVSLIISALGLFLMGELYGFYIFYQIEINTIHVTPTLSLSQSAVYEKLLITTILSSIGIAEGSFLIAVVMYWEGQSRGLTRGLKKVSQVIDFL